MKPTTQILLGLAVVLLTVFLPHGRAAQQQTAFATDSAEQRAAIAAAMKEHSYSISLQNGALAGPGMDFIARNAASAQFVLFGEEHNMKEFPGVMTALFTFLHQQDNFNYFAFESVALIFSIFAVMKIRFAAHLSTEEPSLTDSSKCRRSKSISKQPSRNPRGQILYIGAKCPDP